MIFIYSFQLSHQKPDNDLYDPQEYREKQRRSFCKRLIMGRLLPEGSLSTELSYSDGVELMNDENLFLLGAAAVGSAASSVATMSHSLRHALLS